MKILWMSDSPTSPSGFGNVTRFVCAGLAEQGHRVSILGWQTRGQPQPWRDCTLYPVRHAGFGADVLHTYLRRLQPDILITLADIWWLTFISDPLNANFMRAANIPWALYYPVDGDMGDMLLPSSWVHILQTVDVPVAMSRYGQAVSHANGITPTYIPHGVDTKVFHPPADKLEAKGKLGYDGRFVILSDARNQPRKMWPRTIEIFRRFARAKDDVVLHIHCDPNDPAARALDYCYDLRSDIAFLNLGDKVRFSPDMSVTRGLALEQLASIYQAADVHLLSSWGEGFGLPNLQACSSGVVPLAADYTASQELVEGHGETIRVKHYVPDQFGLRRALIDMDDAVHKLERLYRDRALLAAKAAAARQFAEAYDWEQVVPLWQELIEREVPRARRRLHFSKVATSRVTLHSQTAPNAANLPAFLAQTWPQPQPPPDQNRSDLARLVRSTFNSLPENVQVTVNIQESKANQLRAEVFQDVARYDQILTIPVTLPIVDTSIAKTRVTGCIYAASRQDLPALEAIFRIFPGLTVWSTSELELVFRVIDGKPARAKVVAVGSPDYRRHLAVSTLALDLGGFDPALPLLAAELGVPCIGLAGQKGQARLWPELSLETADPVIALGLVRRLWTDQGEAGAVCQRARDRMDGRMVC